MFTISFKGKSCLEYKVFPSRRPDIPIPKKRINEIEIAGRDGILTETDGDYEPITIPVEFNFREIPEIWNTTYRNIKKWLSGNGILEFSDDRNFCYKVLYITFKNEKRKIKKIGTFTAEFICEPYSYFKAGQETMEPERARVNPGDECHPIYKITGDGDCTIKVNEKQITATVGQNLTIDTELMIAYRKDGTMQNTEITGKYEDLYLREGENTVEVSPGFTLTMIPNWRGI